MGASAAVCFSVWECRRAAAANPLPLELREGAASYGMSISLHANRREQPGVPLRRESTTGAW